MKAESGHQTRQPDPTLRLRRAEPGEVLHLQSLIRRSGLQLSEPFYNREQAEAITRYVYGVDSQLIKDATYFVIEIGSQIVACGGWSKRRTLYGGDQTKSEEVDPLLDPETEPARIRAFFVDPSMARQGLATKLLDRCLIEARAAGFHALELAATMPGEPLYLACGFVILERFDLALPENIRVPLSRMRREI